MVKSSIFERRQKENKYLMKKDIIFLSKNRELVSKWHQFFRNSPYRLIHISYRRQLKSQPLSKSLLILDYSFFSFSKLKLAKFVSSLRHKYPYLPIMVVSHLRKMKLPASLSSRYILSCPVEALNRKEAENIVRNLNMIAALLEEKKEKENELKKFREREKSLMLIDPLTGTYNYHYFRRRLEEEFKRAKRFIHSLYLVLLDIDFLESINEEMGEETGDKVIRQLAALLRNSLRHNDILSHIEGGRFSIILPEVDLEEVRLAIKRIFNKIEHTEFGERKHPLSLKVSVGVSGFPYKNVNSASQLFKTAAIALDYSKSKGGGRVNFYFDKIVYVKEKEQLEELKSHLKTLNRLLSQSVIDIVYGFAKTIEAKDRYTGNHVEETAAIALRIGKMFKLSQKALEDLSHAAILHDLGKVAIDKKILLKKGKLTPSEWKIIKKHPVIGSEIIKTIHALRGAVAGVLYHHERYDGNGYPEKLRGEEIPLIARVVAIADTYQALTSDRPYRKAFSHKEAIEIIKGESGVHFDPEIVKAFLKAIKFRNKPHK